MRGELRKLLKFMTWKIPYDRYRSVYKLVSHGVTDTLAIQRKKDCVTSDTRHFRLKDFHESPRHFVKVLGLSAEWPKAFRELPYLGFSEMPYLGFSEMPS